MDLHGGETDLSFCSLLRTTVNVFFGFSAFRTVPKVSINVCSVGFQEGTHREQMRGPCPSNSLCCWLSGISYQAIEVEVGRMFYFLFFTSPWCSLIQLLFPTNGFLPYVDVIFLKRLRATDCDWQTSCRVWRVAVWERLRPSGRHLF